MSAAAIGKTKSWKVILFSALGGGVVGGGSISVLIWLGGDELLEALSGSRVALAAVGLIYLLISAMIGLGLIAPRAGAKLLNVEDAEELIDERPKLLRSTFFMLVVGLALTLLALSRGPGFAEGVVPPAVGLAAMIVLLLLGLVSFRWMPLYDELDVKMGFEGGTWAFLLSAAVLLPWATLDALGWTMALHPFDVITVLAASLLVGPFIAVGKRGMMVR